MIVAVVCVSATACAGANAGGTDSTAPASPATGQPSAPTSAPNDQPPPEPKPTAQGPCPYLQTAWVEDANGQHIQKVEISADTPHPACFFVRPDGEVDVTVQVFSGTPKAANALVNRAAPVATSAPTNEPAGWSGGLESFGKTKGAVYAVRKEGTGIAVVVQTNQAQTFKAKRIAEQAIQQLRL